MKKLFKWFAIITAALLLLLLIAGFGIRWYFNNFESLYPSGGILSENQRLYDVIFYDINLEALLDDEALKGYTTIRLKALADDLELIELDLLDLFTIDSVLVAGQQAQFEHRVHKLFVESPTPLQKADIADIRITYSGQPPVAKYPPWLGGFTWTKDDSGYAWVGLSCQGEGGKIWFPCKDHPSDEPDSVAVNITVPADYFVASNGLLTQTTIPKEGFKTYHWLTKYPINNYLVNIGIGRFTEVKDSFTCRDGTTIPVIFYVLPQFAYGADAFVREIKTTMNSYTKYFGDYPWKKEKIAFLNTPFSGMEHQTLIAYGNNYRVTHIDSFSFDPLLVHELAHEWWGNKVTVHDWADFWIHEGFATYAEALLVLDMAGEEAYHKYMNHLQSRVVNYAPVIGGENLNSSESYHTDIYSKGAAFIHTLRYVLGDSLFFKTVREFATDSNYTYLNHVDTQDFIDLIEMNSGKDLTALFDLYLKTNIYPEIKIDSIAQSTYTISIPNIDFGITMDISVNDSIQLVTLGPEPVTVTSSQRPVVDKHGWFLKESD